MASIEVTHQQASVLLEAHPSPSCRVHGRVTARWASPAGWGLWAVTANLDTGATMEWLDDHGDEAIYVVGGSLQLAGGVCPTRGAFVVEAGTPATARALEPTQIVHFGPGDIEPPIDGFYGPPERGHCVHIVGPLGRHGSADAVSETRFFADATCPSCRAMLFLVARSRYVSSGHSHSQDELIHVLSGEITVGRRHIAAGDTIAIRANARYAFRGGPEGFAFLNYRRDVSHQTIDRSAPAMLEGGEAAGIPFVGDVIA